IFSKFCQSYEVNTDLILECSKGQYWSKNSNECLSCPAGYATVSPGSKTVLQCNVCKSEYKYTLIDNNLTNKEYSFECIQCPNNKIASVKDGHKATECLLPANCSMSQYISKEKQCKDCSEAIIGSLYRMKNRKPLKKNCICPKKKPLVYYNGKPICATKNMAKVIFKKIEKDGYKFGYNDDNFEKKLQFNHCHPFHRLRSLNEIRCVCRRGMIFSENKCEECKNGRLKDLNGNILCTKCLNN
ncbi:MAG: hypothetical protein MHPSP_001586, partial [Paramarteilia canceri]